MSLLIPRDSTIPVRKEMVLTTCYNNQPNVLVKVYQGESVSTDENNLLGYVQKKPTCSDSSS